MSSDHVKHVAHFVAEVFGSEKLYWRGQRKPCIMIGHHIGKMLTEEKRQRWMSLLLQTADETGLKAILNSGLPLSAIWNGARASR